MIDGPVSPKNTMFETLGIEIVELTTDRVILDMPIGPAVHQPMGVLHGGASATLAESAASLGAFANCEPDAQYAVGIELNISHLRSRSDGMLRATAVPVRKGRTVHVWNIDLVDSDGAAVATARCTLAIRDLRREG
jgi:1,4-dihydroxy-2-naphthoyl-CoA hydrolase